MQLSNYAIILNNVVQNVVVGTFYECDKVAKAMYGEDAFAIEVWSLYYPPRVQVPVATNDVYRDGIFYRNGIEVLPVPTEQEQILMMQDRMRSANVAIDDIIIAITPQEEN